MKKRRKHRRRALLLLTVLIAAAAYFVYDSASNIEVTHYEVKSEKLPDEFDGFRIVQLSDFHGADFAEELSELVRAETPDIIVITGDILTEKTELPQVEKLLRSISGLAPVYFISGNHDFGSGAIDEISEMLADYGVRYLRNGYVNIEKNGARIVLAGVEDPNSYADMPSPDEVAKRLREEYPHDYAVLLGHRNYWAEEYPALPVDLILCGHAHGGLIRLPGVGGLISTDRTLFPDYDGGMYDCGGYTLIVSRGLGNSVSVPRLFNRPELVCVTLSAE